MKIEFRKVIAFGKDSYVLSLPKKWILANKIKKGDTIGIHEGNNSLIIAAGLGEIKNEDAVIIIEAQNKSLARIKAEIISAYLNAYSTIEILSPKIKDDGQKIKDILRSLAGLEIIEQTSTRVVAKDLIDINEVSIKTLIRRMDVITKSMIEDAISCIDDSSISENLILRDLDVNRLYYLACRIIKIALKNPNIANKLKTSPWELHNDQQVILRLEKIADRQKRIVRYLKDTAFRKTDVEELKKLYTVLKDRFCEVMKAYYTNNEQLAYQIELGNRERIMMLDNFLEEGSYCVPELQKKTKQRQNHTIAVSKIIENFKAMATSIKYIARNVMERE